MIAEILAAVLSSFVTKVAEDFLQRRRDTVSVTELQEQVLGLAIERRKLEAATTEARMAVLALARHLASTHSETFVLADNEQLALAPEMRTRAQREAVVEEAIGSFSASLERTIAGASPQNRNVQAGPPNRAATGRADSSAREVALAKFLDGFEEEIMQARLERGSEP